MFKGDSDFLRYKIKLRNRVTQNDVTLWVTNSNKFYRNCFCELLTRLRKTLSFTSSKVKFLYKNKKTSLARSRKIKKFYFKLLTQSWKSKISYRVTNAIAKLLFYLFRVTNSCLKNKNFCFDLAQSWKIKSFYFEFLKQNWKIKMFTLSYSLDGQTFIFPFLKLKKY